MNDFQPVSQDSFRRILSRNISLPLGVGALSAALFLGLIAYLLTALNWVEHSEHAIGKVSEVSRLSSDMETGMRGFLIAGDETFLQPYEIARSRFASEVAELSQFVGDNRVQVARLKHMSAGDICSFPPGHRLYRLQPEPRRGNRPAEDRPQPRPGVRGPENPAGR